MSIWRLLFLQPFFELSMCKLEDHLYAIHSLPAYVHDGQEGKGFKSGDAGGHLTHDQDILIS